MLKFALKISVKYLLETIKTNTNIQNRFKFERILIGYLQTVIAGNNVYTVLFPNPQKHTKFIQISIVKINALEALLAELVFRF